MIDTPIGCRSQNRRRWKMETLEPCQLCGGEAVLNYYISAYVYCKRCGIEGKHFDTFEVESAAKNAIEAWNRRAYERSDT